MNDYTDAIDPSKPLYDQLVGDGNPFADNEALARSKIESNITIRQREEELARIRADLETRLNYEEFLERLKETAPINAGNHTVPNVQNNEAPITPQDIERIVEQREQKKRLETNLDNALTKYSEVNGPNSALKLKQQATELGMSEQQLKDMAANNPKLFYKVTGVEETKPMDNFQAPPRTQVNMEAMSSAHKPNAEAQYFKNLYKTKPHEYWSPAVQNKIMDAVKNGRLTADDII